MSLDPLTLVVSFAISGCGFVLFSYGKKMQRIPQLVAGLVLLVFPYFIPGVIWPLVIAAVVLGVMWLGVLRGF